MGTGGNRWDETGWEGGNSPKCGAETGDAHRIPRPWIHSPLISTDDLTFVPLPPCQTQPLSSCLALCRYGGTNRWQTGGMGTVRTPGVVFRQPQFAGARPPVSSRENGSTAQCSQTRARAAGRPSASPPPCGRAGQERHAPRRWLSARGPAQTTRGTAPSQARLAGTRPR
jgi:hypothetical protein